MATPIETAIDTAWSSAFQAVLGGKPNPSYIPSILAAQNSALGDLDNVPDSTKQVDVCTVPDDPSSPCPKGAATLSFTSMTVAGYNNATSSPPAFAPEDATVQLPMTLPQMTVQGDFSVSQTCCIPTLLGCNGNYPGSDQGSFKLTLNNNVITLNCSIDAQGSSMVLNSVDFKNNGSCSVSVSGKVPSWLNWLDKLFSASEQLGEGIQKELSNLLSSQQLMTPMQNALNGLLGSSGTAAARVTRDSLQHMALASGLSPDARPYGPVVISEVNGLPRYDLRFAVHQDNGVSGWLCRVTTTSITNGVPSYQTSVGPLGGSTPA